MAQTWLVTKRKLRAARIANAVLRPFLPLLRVVFPPNKAVAEPRNILVSELWHIGDVVIAVPFLAALRDRFPNARVTLLSKRHAQDTLANSGLVDDVIAFDVPWTFLDEGKRTPANWLRLPSLLRELRRREFDLAFDCSRDGRNHMLLFLSGAARRVGFDFGGGEFLLTDRVAADSLDMHRSDDWLRLLSVFGPAATRSAPPLNARLVIAEDERAWAESFLCAQGWSPGDYLVAVHPGGSSKLKRWSLDSFSALADMTAGEYAARILWLVDPSGTGADARLPDGSIKAKPTLRQLMALLERCDLLICNDGGPMHLAAALGVPTFAVYSWGKPEWWRPPFSNVRHSWIQRGDITCRPCAGHCVFAEPICLTGLNLDTAKVGLRSELATLRPRRAERQASSR